LEIEKPRKRKLIELVKTSVLTAAAASLKERAPKKKARTITGQATSAYAEEEVPAKPAPLLQYFSRQTTERINDEFKVPAKPRSKIPVKRGSKAKKGSAEAPILLSPESALKQSGNQDFVFGTSSQLAREESPTLLRDLHEAMQASNEADEDDPFAELVYEATSANRGRALISAKHNLWSAAARDSAGDLLEVEIVDLVDSPVVIKQINQRILSEVVVPLKDEVGDDVWHDIEESCEKQSQTIKIPQKQQTLSDL
jgi:hypothetical protein